MRASVRSVRPSPVEGDRQAKINRNEGDRQEMIAVRGREAEGINEAEPGVEIRASPKRRPGYHKIAAAISDKGGATR